MERRKGSGLAFCLVDVNDKARAKIRFWPFAAAHDSAVQVRLPPNNGLHGDAPRAVRA